MPPVPSAAAVIRAAAAKDAAAVGFEVVPRSGRGSGGVASAGSSDSGDSSSDDEGRVANKAVLPADESSSDDDEAFMDSLDAQGKVRCATWRQMSLVPSLETSA
jgi:hypothetical protein